MRAYFFYHGFRSSVKETRLDRLVRLISAKNQGSASLPPCPPHFFARANLDSVPPRSGYWPWSPARWPAATPALVIPPETAVAGPPLACQPLLAYLCVLVRV